ncbi:MAG: hypothetical protein HYU66_12755 [Armatimonadetes bacterium]|nr:hypothetical protein [Armatimonadota bacterium]
MTDTGPLLHLAEIARLPVLASFEPLTMPTEVHNELGRLGAAPLLAASLAVAPTVATVSAAEIAAQVQALAGYRLSAADLAVAALVERCRPCILLTDDLELRRATAAHGQPAVGSVGLLFRAFGDNRLDRDGLESAIDDLLNRSTLYLSRPFRLWVLGEVAKLTA